MPMSSIFPSAWCARPSPFSVTAVSRWVSWKAWEVSRSESCKGWDSQTADATKIYISPKVTETFNFLHVDFSIPKLIRNLACFSCQVVDQSSVLGITQYMCGTLPDWVGAMVSHMFYREGLQRMLKSNSHLLALEDISQSYIEWFKMMSQNKMQDVSSNRRWLCFFDDDFIPPIAGSSILVRISVRFEGWFGSGWNCYESLRRPLALCLLRLLQTMAAVGAPNQMVDEESLS